MFEEFMKEAERIKEQILEYYSPFILAHFIVGEIIYER